MAVQPFTLTPLQKRFVTAGYYGSFLAVGLVTASLGPALPYLAEKTQVSLSVISILFASRSMGRILGALLSGKLYDHFRGHSLLILSLTILGLTTVLTPLPAILWGLIFITFLNGIAQGMLNVGGNTLLVWLHGAKVAPWMNGLHFFFGIGIDDRPRPLFVDIFCWRQPELGFSVHRPADAAGMPAGVPRPGRASAARRQGKQHQYPHRANDGAVDCHCSFSVMLAPCRLLAGGSTPTR